MSQISAPTARLHLLSPESDLVAALLNGGCLAAAAGLALEHFESLRLGRLFAAIRVAEDGGNPLVLSMLEPLLPDEGDRVELRELVYAGSLAATTESHVRRLADCVRRDAAERRGRDTGHRLFSGEIGLSEARTRLDLLAVDAAGRAFPGLTLEEVIAAEIPDRLDLIDGLVEAASVGFVVGLPEAGKSLLSLLLAFSVASGRPFVGREIISPGPVGIWIQDGSTARGLERLKRFAQHFGRPPVRVHVNEGLALPDDLDAIRREVNETGQRLVVLDSVYSFLPLDSGLRDESAAHVIERLKREVADTTGATVLLVDHSPWPGERSRGRPRPLGSVFKSAQSRWTISIVRKQECLTITASGNDVAGLHGNYRLAEDGINLVPAGRDNPTNRTEVIAKRMVEFLAQNPASSQTEIHRGAKANNSSVTAILKSDPRFREVERRPELNPRARCFSLDEQFVSNQRDELGRTGTTGAPDSSSDSGSPL